MLRTIEQVLGLPPMNQFDASATPMWDCFNAVPDWTPFESVPSQVALDELNPPVKTVKDRASRRNAELSARLNFQQVDRAPEDVLNRILWQAMKGNGAPYPAWAAGAEEEEKTESGSFWKRLFSRSSRRISQSGSAAGATH
jgi:hypothetical protein